MDILLEEFKLVPIHIPVKRSIATKQVKMAYRSATYPNLVVLDADLAAATKTGMFKKAYPDRFFDCGIAEANMMGIPFLKIRHCSRLCILF